MTDMTGRVDKAGLSDTGAERFAVAPLPKGKMGRKSRL